MDHQAVITFWFETLEPKHWYVRDQAVDAQIQKRFAETHNQAIQCELYPWRAEPLGRLAEIIVLDQFSRNLFRDDGRAFAYDPLALALAQEAIARGADQAVPANQRAFFYMPFMHSESLLIHEEAVRLFAQEGMERNLEFEHKHKVILERFGRYPHRNAVLGRESTAQEVEFLKRPESQF